MKPEATSLLENSEEPSTKLAEIRVNKLAANVLSGVFTIVLCFAGLKLAQMLPRHVSWKTWHWNALLASVVVLIPIHELLHGVGLRLFARVPWNKIKFGVMWHALMPYCACKVPLLLRAYRQMALLPLWVTGGASIIAVLVFATEWLGILSGVAVAVSIGDIWMIAKLRRFAPELLVQDCPSDIGCDVLTPRRITSGVTKPADETDR